MSYYFNEDDLVIKDEPKKENVYESLLMEMADEEKSVVSHMTNVILHLLKVMGQPDHQTKSWLHSIANSYKEVMEYFDKKGPKRTMKILHDKESKIYKAALSKFEEQTHKHNIKEVPDVLSIDALISGKKKYILTLIKIHADQQWVIDFSETLDYGC